MNENINLCELLKGHEGETFYTTIYGNCELYRINDGTISISNRNFFSYFNLESDGKFCTEGECVIFPSKDQRDWNKWAEKIDTYPKVEVVTWPEIQDYMHCEGFNDNCFLANSESDVEEYGSSAYYVNKEWKRKMDKQNEKGLQ